VCVAAGRPRAQSGSAPVAIVTDASPTLPGRQTMSVRLVDHALTAVRDRLTGRASGGLDANPLVIVGPRGAGKSRLLAAWFMETQGAILWDGPSLGRDLAAALSHDTVDRLHGRFVSARLVIIDGVEQITAWDAQRFLGHLIDAALDASVTIVVTLRTHPIACTSLEPTLASRLSGGLVVALPPVGLGRSGPVDGRDAATKRRPPTIRRVIGATSRCHGLTPEDIVGPGRSRRVAHARAVAMYLARTLTAGSLEAIGRAFGGRDHTTVLHGVRMTQARRSSDPALEAEIDRLIDQLTRS
jgi:chromosomal replication initiation ATPase DnaA